MFACISSGYGCVGREADLWYVSVANGKAGCVAGDVASDTDVATGHIATCSDLACCGDIATRDISS